MAPSTSTGSAASSPNPQATTVAVQPTAHSKATPAPVFKVSPHSRDTASYLESATDTKLNQDDLQAWLAVDLEHSNFCDFNRLLNHMFSLRVPDGLTIDNDLLLDKCLRGVLPIRHLEEVINCIKAYCAEAPNAGRDRYSLNDPSLDNVAARAVDGAYCGMLNDWGLAPTIGLSCHDGIERTGTLSFRGIDVCHADSWAGLITRLYRHELEGDIWVLPWTHLQCDEKNVIRSHPQLVPWTGNLGAARNAKQGMYADWGDYTPLAPWKDEWQLSFELCKMIDNTHVERYQSQVLAAQRRSSRRPRPGHVELSTEAVYDRFWVAVEEFYDIEGDLDGYRALREELCLPVDV